ncbi:MAG: ATP-binding protein [Acidobacteriota bacterium]
MGNPYYLERIKDSNHEYIDDPWLFLRELSQNSRDASAREIKIDLGGFGSEKEVIIFSDNGKGMTFKDATKYLFRLYSSSKTYEKYSIGMYGIGFWTIMKFEPDEIRVESYSEEEEKWGISLNSKLEYGKIECQLKRYGTRITLSRKRKFEDFSDFKEAVKKGVLKYCRYLDRKGKNGEQLPVIFRGKYISDRLKPGEGISLSYKGRNFEGIVALGSQPKVRFYTGGIPAWEGSTLEELSLVNGETRNNENYLNSGIAPVFYINGRDLKVNMSRKELIDSRSLRKIIKRSGKALKKLVQKCTDHAYPRGRLERIFDLIKNGYRNIKSSYWKIAIAVIILIVPIEFIVLKNFYSLKLEKVEPPELIRVEEFRHYGATVGTIGKDVIAGISYSPPVDVQLKMFTAPLYKKKTGFVRRVKRNSGKKNLSYGIDKTGFSYTFIIEIKNRGEIFLPRPDGYRIDPQSVKINNRSLESMKTDLWGDSTLNVKRENSLLKYKCFPEINNSEKYENGSLNNYLYFPSEVRFPEELEKKIPGYFYLKIKEKVELSVKITNILLKYDASDGTARYYKDYKPRFDWLKKVLEIGAGDCDVINGVYVLLLRKMGVRSRLVVGLSGEKGKVEPNLHAWAEYYESGWNSIDASLTAERVNMNAPPAPEFFTGKMDRKNIFDQDKNSGLITFTKMILFLLFLLIIPLIIYIKKNYIDKKDVAMGLHTGQKGKARRDIIEIARSYLLNPEIWNYNFNIADQKIITTFKGERISIKEVVKLTRAGKLFKGSRENRLVKELINTKTVILDSGDKIHEPLIRLFSAIFDLDKLLSMSVETEGENGSTPAALFLRSVNSALRSLKWKNIICLNAPGLSDSSHMDIDLSEISSPDFFKNMKYPEKFIAVNLRSPIFAPLVDLFQKNPGLAAYRFLDIITERSLFFLPDMNIARRRYITMVINNG